MSKPVLFDYFRSSTAYRVRIALNLKGVEYERVPVNLLQGEQRAEAYRARNPQGLVPTLEIDGRSLTQSLAIIAYLDQTRPAPPLLPRDPADAAHVRAMALIVACDIHPLSNLRIRKHLVETLGISQEERLRWDQKWIREGLAALEASAAPRSGRFLFGDAPTLADICLVPQLYNARRFEVALDAYPTLVRADAEANRLEAFAAAHPDAIGAPSREA